jgi:hypothetical protein
MEATPELKAQCRTVGVQRGSYKELAIQDHPVDVEATRAFRDGLSQLQAAWKHTCP